MERKIAHILASTTSNFLKVVLRTEAHANSAFWGYEPQVPESLSKFKKDLTQKEK